MEYAQVLSVVNPDMCDDINLYEALDCDGETVIADSEGGEGDSQVVTPGSVFVGEEGEGVDEVRSLLRSWRVRESSINHLTNTYGFDTVASLTEAPEKAIYDIDNAHVPLADRCTIIKRSSEYIATLRGLTRGGQELQDPAAFQSPQSDSDFRPLLSTPSSGCSVNSPLTQEKVCNDLRDLLQSSPDHNVKSLAKGGKLKDQEVRLLSHTIVEHLLQKAVEEDTNNVRVSYSTFSRWAAAVSELFEEQLQDTWFNTQRPQGGNNVVNSRRPFGKLWERYNNRKKSYTVEGITVRRRSRSNSSASTNTQSTDDGDQSQPSTSSRRRKLPKEDLTSPVDTRDLAAEKLRVLWNNSDFKVLTDIGTDGSQVEALKAAFAACRDQRLDYLNVVSVDEYLDKLPVFCLPSIGQTLLETDFNFLQPTVDNCALLKGLNEHREAIHLEATDYLKKLKGTARGLLKKALTYYNSTGEDATRNSAALLLLPLILKGGQSLVGTRVSTTTSAEAFVLRAESIVTAEETISQRGRPGEESGSGNTGKRGRESKLKQLHVQPLVIAIGSRLELDGVASYLVYVNRILYTVENLVTAVDLCFKCCYVFNLHYSPECEHVWQVIQELFYGIPHKNQRVIAGVKEFVAKIKNRSEKKDSQEVSNYSD